MYLIVGASGFVGSYAIREILEKTTDRILATDKNIEGQKNTERIEWIPCDITVHEDLCKLNERLKKEEPVKIVYLAAYHNPDLVLANPHIAWNINITALSDFLNTVENVKCLFYSSTEMVYKPGEMNVFFKEDTEKEPINAYGRHKMVAEQLVMGYGYNVVRFPFMIGPSILPGKKHFYDVIVETIQNGKTIEMFEDNFKTALDFATAVQTLIALMEKYTEEMPKVLNIAGDEVLSKYDIGIKIADKYGCSRDLIVPISMQNDTKIFTEKRANCTLLDNTAVKEALGIEELKLQF